MISEDNPARDTYVVEKWWHRLLRVLMYGSTCIALGIAGLLLINDSANYTYSYSYSFEPNYEQAEGVESTCSYHEGLNFLSCGTGNTLDNIIKRYRAVRESIKPGSGSAPWEKDPIIEPAPDKSYDEYIAWRTDKLLYEMYDGAKDPAKYAIMNALKGDKIFYRVAKQWNAGPLAQSVGLTLAIGTLWYVLIFLIYKIILFIAYGHTSVRKV